MLIGAHESVSGGLELAFGRARDDGCEALQIFTRNQQQWNAKPVSAAEARRFAHVARESGYELSRVLVHNSYLINLATPEKGKLKSSRTAMLAEVRRCEKLGLEWLNFHPGSHVGRGEEEGLARVVESLQWLVGETPNSPVILTLETTAGQGTCLGHRFEHLRKIIDGVGAKKRFAVCLDTAHTFAAGYDFSTEKGYERVMEEFDDVIGLKHLKWFHLNDSKKPLGSRVDRHEEIGKGCIGETAFRCLMNDPRHEKALGVLELPLDTVPRNLALLRSFVKKEKKRSRPRTSRIGTPRKPKVIHPA